MAEVSLPAAVSLARTLGAAVTLFHVIERDAPQDIQAARANRIRAISVNTGITPIEELETLQPDRLLRDLREYVPFVYAAILLIVLFLMPQGLAGLPAQLWQLIKRPARAKRMASEKEVGERAP